MGRALRENAGWALGACAGAALGAWLTLTGYAWTDYEQEALPAVRALTAGDLSAFLHLSPAYGGSLVERAPFALLPGLWGGGALAVYRAMTLPALLAVAALGVWLVARMRARGVSVPVRAAALAVCVFNPILLVALEIGHAEELLGACLCVAAVLLASAEHPDRRRAAAAGILLGLAVADKDWALLAAGPVLLALPAGRRVLAGAMAGLAAALPLAPLLLASSGSFASATGAVGAAPSPIFQPWQLWWFLGRHGALVHGSTGAAKPGYRLGPAWIEAHSHLLVVLAGLLLAGALWRALGRRGAGARLGERDALAALSLLLLLRCMLDTWDFVYYTLPFVLALLTFETAPANAPRAPAAAISATAAIWLDFEWLPGRVSPDAVAAIFLAWSLPLAAWLAAEAFGVRVSRIRLRRRSAHDGAVSLPGMRAPLGALPQEMTARSFERPVSTSRPPSRTTTRSSIRTPSAPGR